jgi:hypothetical protein
MDTFHQARRGGLHPPLSVWDLQLALVDHVAKVWKEPDEGIWEVRGPRTRFTYSRVLAWVTPTSWPMASTAAATPSSRPMASRRWTRACCCWRRWASWTLAIRASSERWRRSSANCW